MPTKIATSTPPTAAGNLTVRKLYGKDQIRYLRCHAGAREFSERRNTALFNSLQIAERKAISVAEHLAEGISTKGTSRLVEVSAETVRRLREGTLEITQESSTKIRSRKRRGYLGADGRALWVHRLQEAPFVEGNRHRA